MLGLADELGLEVVDEGVETPAQLAALHDAGCALFQGSCSAGQDRWTPP